MILIAYNCLWCCTRLDFNVNLHPSHQPVLFSASLASTLSQKNRRSYKGESHQSFQIFQFILNVLSADYFSFYNLLSSYCPVQFSFGPFCHFFF